MKSDDGTLQVEITIVPARSRRLGRRCMPLESKAPDPPRIPRIARLMALAIKFQSMVDRGEVRDFADLARLGYVTRARITQIMNMLNLAPDIQEELLTSPMFAVQANVPERGLRQVAAVVGWGQQRRLWEELGGKHSEER